MTGRDGFFACAAILCASTVGAMALTLTPPACEDAGGTAYSDAEFYRDGLRSARVLGGPLHRGDGPVYVLAACGAAKQIVVHVAIDRRIDEQPQDAMRALIVMEKSFTFNEVAEEMNRLYGSGRIARLSRSNCFCRVSGQNG